MVSVRAINHVCFTVSDLDASVEFWTGLLGSTPESRTEYSSQQDQAVTGYAGVRMSAAYFRLPGGLLLELFEYHEPSGEQPSSSETYVVGNAHLGIVVDDLDEIHRRLQETGCTFRSDGPVRLGSGEHSGGRSMYVRDPDGITIELLDFDFEG